MPITPLHFGPGLLLKAAASRHFSWCSFVAANVLIDIEPATYWVLEGEPAHRFFHTYIGSTLAAIVAALLSMWLLPHWLRWWNSQMSPSQANYLGVRTELSKRAIWCGALLGAWSHVLLDSIMHYDVVPFSPFAGTNVLVSWISIDQLYWACLVCGGIGAAWMIIRKQTASRK
jgi:hypothetical protein